MNQRICKQLRRQARTLTEQVRTEYNEAQNQKPKQCGFIQQTLPSGTSVTVPNWVQTVKRTAKPECQRGMYLQLKARHPL